jgi:hypothetical protein
MHLRNDYPLELEGGNLLKIGQQLENEECHKEMAQKIVKMFEKHFEEHKKEIPIDKWLDEKPFQMHEELKSLHKLDDKLCKLASLLGLGNSHDTKTEKGVQKLVGELRKVIADPARYRKNSKKVRIHASLRHSMMTHACMYIFPHTAWCTCKCKQL